MGFSLDDEAATTAPLASRRRGRRRKWAAVVVLLLVLGGGATCWAYSQSPMRIRQIAQVPGHATHLVVFSSDVRWGTTTLTVHETPTEVQVHLMGRRFGLPCSCVGRYVVTLSDPLGTRTVVDAGSGSTMTVGVDDSWTNGGE